MFRFLVLSFGVALIVFAQNTAIAVSGCPFPPNECAMFGGLNKTGEMKAMEESYLAKVEEMGLSRKEGAIKSIELGWKYFFQGQPGTAMKRFNQAWLLAPENGDIYHGMAVIVADRDKAFGDADRLFRKALASESVSPGVYSDFGIFLIRTGKPEEAEELLRSKIVEFPNTRNLRYNLAVALLVQEKLDEACSMGQEASAAGDLLEDRFLSDACGTDNP